jgi:hypothetical protein
MKAGLAIAQLQEQLKDRQDYRRTLIDRVGKAPVARLEYWQGKLIRVEAQIRELRKELANAN